MDKVDLSDPTADYCKSRVKIVNKFTRSSNKAWFALFRKMGCSAIESLSMARFTTQDSFDRIDLSVNFDGPMV